MAGALLLGGAVVFRAAGASSAANKLGHRLTQINPDITTNLNRRLSVFIGGFKISLSAGKSAFPT
jgi:hypothetical protein